MYTIQSLKIENQSFFYSPDVKRTLWLHLFYKDYNEMLLWLALNQKNLSKKTKLNKAKQKFPKAATLYSK